VGAAGATGGPTVTVDVQPEMGKLVSTWQAEEDGIALLLLDIFVYYEERENLVYIFFFSFFRKNGILKKFFVSFYIRNHLK
jgi:hypothetical protein